ncbi:hypothetical protein [Arthrobacter sp. Soil762]|uniref:hypothetical protein n=1 Tax=Arthrobacter sp. Soil762 TaxID=1736401 RepID=UPI0007002307|nr:hypothetical protein [Arthrobacter sp. Soil762]KRE71709.1 hypothetical protein ASG77_11890 [Arthrobacter sp. Soil762]
MSNAGEWAARLKAFHEKQLDRPRRVYRLGRTKIILSRGHIWCTAGAAVGAVSVDSPDWLFWVASVAGLVGGKYFFPVPRSSVASRYDAREVARKSPGDLDYMTPAEILAYQYNVQFIQKSVTPLELGTEDALARQSEAARTVSRAVGADAGSLAHLSQADVTEYGRTAGRHDLLKRRWLTYEMDPRLQFDYPAMSDVFSPPTAAMIKALGAADQQRTAGSPADYKLAVDRFSQALAAAESAAGVP